MESTLALERDTMTLHASPKFQPRHTLLACSVHFAQLCDIPTPAASRIRHDKLNCGLARSRVTLSTCNPDVRDRVDHAIDEELQSCSLFPTAVSGIRVRRPKQVLCALARSSSRRGGAEQDLRSRCAHGSRYHRRQPHLSRSATASPKLFGTRRRLRRPRRDSAITFYDKLRFSELAFCPTDYHRLSLAVEIRITAMPLYVPDALFAPSPIVHSPPAPDRISSSSKPHHNMHCRSTRTLDGAHPRAGT